MIDEAGDQSGQRPVVEGRGDEGKNNFEETRRAGNDCKGNRVDGHQQRRSEKRKYDGTLQHPDKLIETTKPHNLCCATYQLIKLI